MTGRRTKAPRGIDKTTLASTGSTGGLPAWKLRECPTCNAGPGYSCVRVIRGRIQQVDLDGGVYYRQMKGPHTARRARPTVDGTP